MPDPRPTAPRIPPGYGVPPDGSGAELLPWSWAVERLVAARCYWICTTRRDGRPHAAPVWGLWRDDAIWFSTDRASQKARNLRRDPRVVVHLESGDETVIIEGRASEELSSPAREAFADEYEAKYAVRPDPALGASLVLVVRPTAAQTWRERDYPRTATRWVF